MFYKGIFFPFPFYSKEDDWGFAHFISWDDLMEPENCFVKDDSITVEAHVMAEAPHGVSWDSKKYTGYVGKVVGIDKNNLIVLIM